MKFIFLSLSAVLVALSSAFPANAVDIFVIDKNNKPVEGIAVYIKATNLKNSINEVETSPLKTISQKDKKFQPYITIVQAGDMVNFDNQDDITHHIYSAIGKNKFSFKIHANGEEKSIKFEHEGTVPMGCNIHDWMSGHVLVVDTPYYGFTDNKGKLSLPAANGEVFVWHPQLSNTDNKQTLTFNEEQTEITIVLKQAMKDIPKQESLDDFDFLNDY